MQLDGKQIKLGSIPAAQLATAFTANLFLKDGTVAITGTVDAGSQRITNLGQPSAASDAVRLTDLQSVAFKQNVKAASTANLTLSGAQTVDTVALVAGDRVLVKNQTTASANGVYVVATGAWSRAADFDSTIDVRGAVVGVDQGAINGDRRYAQTADNVVVGTDTMAFVDIGPGASAAFETTSNKNMVASVTTADFQVACATTIAATPAGDGYVEVQINGATQTLGDGVKTGDCYFSNDSGSTALTIANIASGATLYWVQSVAGFNLAATDRVNLMYSI